MTKDYLPPPRKPKQPPKPSLAEQWVASFKSRKGEFLSASFGDVSDQEKAIANTSLRVFHGLTHDEETYSALIEWAHTGIKPDMLSGEDIKHLTEQGFLTVDGSAVSETALNVIKVYEPE